LFCDSFTPSFEIFTCYDAIAKHGRQVKEDVVMLTVQIVLFDGFDLLAGILPASKLTGKRVFSPGI